MSKTESFCKHVCFHVLGSFGSQARYVGSEAPPFIFPRMAGAFEKAMVAGQKFLEGLRSLPSYKDAQQKQLRALLKQLGSVTDLTTGQSGKILSMLDEKLWDHESLQQLRQQIADKTEQIPGEAQGRRSLQDFVELPNYLTDSLWQTLLDRKTSGQEALELVCQHAALLGLRLPSESTMAMLLTLAYQGQALAMSEIPSTAKTEAAHQEALGWSSASDLVDDTASRMDRFSCRAQGPEHRILITINKLHGF